MWAALSLLVMGCKKDRSHTSVEGRVIDPTNQTLVAHARVYLLRSQGTSIYASPSRVEHVDTDASGRFSFSFEKGEDETYYLQASAAGFYDTPANEYVFLEPGIKNLKNVPLRPEAWLKVHIISAPTSSTSGVMLTSPVQMIYGIGGANVDSTVVVKSQGNSENHVAWILDPGNGSSVFKNDTVFCAAHDTTAYMIRF